MLPTANLLNGLSISEDDKKVYVEASIPGVDPKDVDVIFEKGLLTIRGEKKRKKRVRIIISVQLGHFFTVLHPMK